MKVVRNITIDIYFTAKERKSAMIKIKGYEKRGYDCLKNKLKTAYGYKWKQK